MTDETSRVGEINGDIRRQMDDVTRDDGTITFGPRTLAVAAQLKDHFRRELEWLTVDDMADIKPGDRVLVHRRGLEITATAYVYSFGAWFTKEGGLILSADDAADNETKWRFL